MKKITLLLLALATQINSAQNIFPSIGYAGVGTTNPTSVMELVVSEDSKPEGVLAPTKSVLKLSRNGTPGYTYNENAEFRIGHGESTYHGSKLDLYINGGSNTNSIPDKHVMTWNYDGNVGIGTTIPVSKLDVRGVISTPEIAFKNTDGGDDSDPYRLRKVQGSSNNNWLELQLNDDPNESFRIYGNSCEGFGCGTYSSNLYHSFDAQGNVYHKGNVGIGTTTPDQKLTVNGTIHSKEVIVDTTIPPDYVFQKYYTGKSELKSDYRMPTLTEIEDFTRKNNHLPNVPSAKEMQENGILVGEMSNILLQKVEELTLYAIEQNKKTQSQQEEIERLKAENEQYKLLAERLAAIEKELKNKL